MGDQAWNISFVKEVEKHEVLYNYTLPGYSQKEVTKKAWQEVAAKVNMPVAECKGKWRNLRTVFIRKLKPPSGRSFGEKMRHYYLSEYMQFCLPFIKTRPLRSPEYVSPMSQNGPATDILEDSVPFDLDDDDDDAAVLLRESSGIAQSQSFDPLESTLVTVKSEWIDVPSPKSSSSQPKRSPTMTNESTSVADQCEAEYFTSKRARLETTTSKEATSCQNIDRREALKMFLLSLLPELDEFSDSQIKLFKRKVFNVMDEISSST